MSLWISFGLCGLGANGGLFPEIRLGVVRVGCCRGAIADHAARARSRLEQALKAVVQGAWNS